MVPWAGVRWLNVGYLLSPSCASLPLHPSLSFARSIASLQAPRHIHASGGFMYSFLLVLSRSASSTLPLRTPVPVLYSPSFSLHPRHVSHPTYSSSYGVYRNLVPSFPTPSFL